MKVSESDMKMMALGELGSFLLAIISAIWTAVALDEQMLLVRIVGSLAVLYLVAKVALGFVHLGYRPETNKG